MDFGLRRTYVFHMNGPEHKGENGVSLVPERDTATQVPPMPLTKVQKFAAEQRAAAEALLAEARDFEQRVSELATLADAAIAGEREATERSRRAREQLAAAKARRERETQRDNELQRAEEAAAAEVTAARERLASAQAGYEIAVNARSAQTAATEEANTAEAGARAEMDVAAQELRKVQEARTQADAQLHALRGPIEADVRANTLSPEAVRRAMERRVADALRHGAQRNAP
jgi:hypothetical protein